MDYWDYIGWPDRFATREHSLRQRAYREVGHTRGIYTPGFVVGGREWRGWFRNPTLDLSPDADVGSISVDVRDGRFAARFEPAFEVPESLELHVARLGFDLSTEVRAGENHGRRLEHDFVVLGWSRHRMSGGGSGYEASGVLPAASNPAPREAVAVWVSVPGDPFPHPGRGQLARGLKFPRWGWGRRAARRRGRARAAIPAARQRPLNGHDRALGGQGRPRNSDDTIVRELPEPARFQPRTRARRAAKPPATAHRGFTFVLRIFGTTSTPSVPLTTAHRTFTLVHRINPLPDDRACRVRRGRCA